MLNKGWKGSPSRFQFLCSFVARPFVCSTRRPDQKCYLWPQRFLVPFPCCGIGHPPSWAPQADCWPGQDQGGPLPTHTEHQPRAGRAAPWAQQLGWALQWTEHLHLPEIVLFLPGPTAARDLEGKSCYLGLAPKGSLFFLSSIVLCKLCTWISAPALEKLRGAGTRYLIFHMSKGKHTFCWLQKGSSF